MQKREELRVEKRLKGGMINSLNRLKLLKENKNLKKLNRVNNQIK
jgi:hypothetical protein